MSSTVFILGAGASKEEVKAPLMNEFLDEADSLLKSGQVDEVKEDFERLSQAISKLQTVNSKSNLDLHNIESIYASFEMGRTLGHFFDYDEENLSKLIDSTKTVIIKTLEQKIKFSITKG